MEDAARLEHVVEEDPDRAGFREDGFVVFQIHDFVGVDKRKIDDQVQVPKGVDGLTLSLFDWLTLEVASMAARMVALRLICVAS